MALQYGSERVWHVQYYNPSTSKWELLQNVKYGSNTVFAWYDPQKTIRFGETGSSSTAVVRFAKLDTSKSYSNNTVISNNSYRNFGQMNLGGGCIKIYNGWNFLRTYSLKFSLNDSSSSYFDTYHYISSGPTFSSIENGSDSENHTSLTIGAYSTKYIWVCAYYTGASYYTGQDIKCVVSYDGKQTLKAPTLTDVSATDSYGTYFKINIRNTNGVPVKVYGRAGSGSYSVIRSNLNPSEEFTYNYDYIYGSTTYYVYFTTTNSGYKSPSPINSITNGGSSGGGSTGS